MSRPAIKAYSWFGGKYTFLKYYTRMMGKHSVYLEPFMGSAAVLLNKKAAEEEYLSDMDSGLVNLMKCIADKNGLNQLIRGILYSDYSQKQFEEAKARMKEMEQSLEPDGTHIQWAVDVYRSIAYSFNSLRKSYRYTANPFANCELWSVNERLQGVHIQKRNALELLKEIKGGEETVVLLDPPYIEDLMGSKKVYRPAFSMDDQKTILDSIRDMDARIILCGYRTPDGAVDKNGNPIPDVYDEGLKKGNDSKGERRWRCYHVADAKAPSGRSGDKRVLSEYVWMNYDPSLYDPSIIEVMSLEEYGSLKLD